MLLRRECNHSVAVASMMVGRRLRGVGRYRVARSVVALASKITSVVVGFEIVPVSYAY